jgi:hypothetical protein
LQKYEIIRRRKPVNGSEQINPESMREIIAMILGAIVVILAIAAKALDWLLGGHL